MSINTEKLEQVEETIAGRLTEAKGVAREQWGKITDDNLEQLAGRKDQVAGRMQAELAGKQWLNKRNLALTLGSVAIAIIAALIINFQPSLRKALGSE